MNLAAEVALLILLAIPSAYALFGRGGAWDRRRIRARARRRRGFLR